MRLATRCRAVVTTSAGGDTGVATPLADIVHCKVRDDFVRSPVSRERLRWFRPRQKHQARGQERCGEHDRKRFSYTDDSNFRSRDFSSSHREILSARVLCARVSCKVPMWPDPSAAEHACGSSSLQNGGRRTLDNDANDTHAGAGREEDFGKRTRFSRWGRRSLRCVKAHLVTESNVQHWRAYWGGMNADVTNDAWRRSPKPQG